MNDMNELSICRWRDPSRPLTVFGIPVLLLPLYLLWFEWMSWSTIYVVSGIIAFFKLLSLGGWTITILWQRLVTLLRGRALTGRPWWYRRFFE